MFGNRVSFYQHNFLECQRNPDIKPEWIYAIWYSDESGWSGQYHIASFRTEEQLKKFAKLIGFKYEWEVYRAIFGQTVPNYKRRGLPPLWNIACFPTNNALPAHPCTRQP